MDKEEFEKLLINGSQEITPVWRKAFIRETGQPVEVTPISDEDGNFLYYDKDNHCYNDSTLCDPLTCACCLESEFNESNAVFALDKSTKRQVIVEPITDKTGFTFYRDKNNNVYSLLELVLSNRTPGTNFTHVEPVKFDNLEDRMIYYRKKTDDYIPKKSYVLAMVDGRTFSSLIKNKFKKPFDDEFISIMNDTASYLVQKVQGAKFAFVQSDEISLFITDNDKPESTLFYDGRLTKLLSVIPAMTTSFFNRRLLSGKINNLPASSDDIQQMIENEPLYQFDCKVWTVPCINDVFAWYLFRQNDCIRNSRQQAAQTYISFNKLRNKTTDEQIAMLKKLNGIDWHTDYDDGKKFGRFVFKETKKLTRIWQGEQTEYERAVCEAHYAHQLSTTEGREWFYKTLIDPIHLPEEKGSFNIYKNLDDYLSKIDKNMKVTLESLSYLSSLCESLPMEIPDSVENYTDDIYEDVLLIRQKTEKVLDEIKKKIVNNS